MALQLYNTLSRKKETFIPQDEKTATLYHCGPTVYHYAHIGNLRAFVFDDILRRAIELEGYGVKQIMNITDVGHLVSDSDTGEDKMEKGAKREGKSAKEIAEFYTNVFFKNIDELNIKRAERYPRATENIPEQIVLIETLEKKGYTYQISDGVYFDTSKYKQYGELARLNTKGQLEGARVVENKEKRNPTDFALWKFSPKDKKREQEWWAPWTTPHQSTEEINTVGSPRVLQSGAVRGTSEEQTESYKTYHEGAPGLEAKQSARVHGSWGFPGWHIECSAMAMRYLGETIDIHTGGIDHIPVHHTNERAQSVCATGKQFARFWLHSGFVNVETGKMAKSSENFLRLETLGKKGFSPLAYRYLLLTAHYRTSIIFSFEALSGAQRALDRLYTILAGQTSKDSSPNPDQEYVKTFTEAIEDDLDTPKAISILWELVKDERVTKEIKHTTLLFFDEILGLDLKNAAQYVSETIPLSNLPKEVQEVINKREEARENKDFSEADKLRAKIEGLGFTIKDTDTGPEVKQKSTF